MNCLCMLLLVCIANINNCKPALLPLGGHQEVCAIEELAYMHTGRTTYTVLLLPETMRHVLLESLKSLFILTSDRNSIWTCVRTIRLLTVRQLQLGSWSHWFVWQRSVGYTQISSQRSPVPSADICVLHCYCTAAMLWHTASLKSLSCM